MAANKKLNLSKELLQDLISSGLRCKDMLEKLKISKRTLYNYLNKFNLSFPQKINFDHTVFDEINTEEKAYWLGFLYADGFVNGKYNNSVELSLMGADIDHINKYNSFLKYKTKAKVSITSKTFTRCRSVVTNKHFHDRLIELGCVPNKSLILKFPSLDIFKDCSLVYPFIRGYVDGDGCLTNNSRSKRLRLEIMGTKEFLSGIMKIFPQFKKLHSTSSSKKNRNNYRLVCSCSVAEEIVKKLYENATIYLERKFKKFAELCRNT